MGQLLRDDGFRIALVVALVTSGVVALLHHRRWLRRLGGPEAGAVASIAALVALSATDRRATLSLVGLALVALGAWGSQRVASRWAPVGAAAPGAVLLAAGLDVPVPAWAAVVLFVAVVVVAPVAAATDRVIPRVLPALLAATAVGMWATTPDTEHTRVLVGATLGAAVLVVDRRLRAGAAGTTVLVALMAWATVVDGHPRPAAVVGGIACFGATALWPLVGCARLPIEPRPVATVLAVQATVVVVCSRVAGMQTRTWSAVTISVASLAGVLVALRVTLRARARPR